MARACFDSLRLSSLPQNITCFHCFLLTFSLGSYVGAISQWHNRDRDSCWILRRGNNVSRFCTTNRAELHSDYSRFSSSSSLHWMERQILIKMAATSPPAQPFLRILNEHISFHLYRGKKVMIISFIYYSCSLSSSSFSFIFTLIFTPTLSVWN